MNLPIQVNLADHYKNDGLMPFEIAMTYASGTPVDLSNSIVKIQLKDIRKVLAWEFSSIEENDKKLTILPAGTIQFPRILSWNLPAAKYYYDIQVTTIDGNVRTYIKGNWKINQDITY